ncbi:MAG TPA: hypothetical protein PKK06_16510 [Phycisphaerae bacterium]|nr:hypothetical protein [Phycisphaerae bacterium]HNU45923.1 hypothetical protein [Phycisphaerae bacterium]
MSSTIVSAEERASTRGGLLGVVVAAVTPLLVLAALFLFGVPIGQPDFLVYRYSPVWPLRLTAAWWALGAGGAGVWLVAVACGARPAAWRWCVAGAVGLYGVLVAWTLWGPPYRTQYHLFNLISPSHDGAFFREGEDIASLREYLSQGFGERLRAEPEQMAGRRVLSNPPGMTVLAVFAQRLVRGQPWLSAWLIQTFGLDELEDPEQRPMCAAMLVLSAWLTVLWGLALWPAYLLCRLWMPPPAALTVAFACVFNPATINFTPGKDPAQILTIMLLMWTVLATFQRRRMGWGLAAGALLPAATMLGLVHVWIIALVAVAAGWHALRSGWRVGELLTRVGLPMLAGAAAVVAVAWVTLGWNLVETAARVAVRYHEIQLPIITEPFYWTLVGLPMFLLFVGPLFWVQLTVLRRGTRGVCLGRTGSGSGGDETQRVLGGHGAGQWPLPNGRGSDRGRGEAGALGGRLLVVAVGVMVYSYFFANNSETPRLWMAFIPVLLLGLALRRPVLLGDGAAARRLCVVLLALQLTVTVGHWSLMDVRETEWRLSTQRMWD